MTAGLQARDYVMAGFERADAIIAVGYDVVEYPPVRWNPNLDKKIIHIDATPAEVDAAYAPVVEVVGDMGMTLQALAEMVPAKTDCAVCHLRPIILNELAMGAEDNGFPLKPQRILADLRKALGDDDLVISDVGAHKLWIARMFPCSRPNTCIISNGLAAMGIALPGAIAAKLVQPHRRVVAVCGDGGVLMNVQELETAVRLGTAFVTLVFNDGGYGVIEWKQMNKYGRPAFVKFGNPDFVKLAEAFGCAGYRVQAADELGPILAEALAIRRPAVIDCPVDYTENLKLTEKLGHITVTV
jgi:acetolactate synthase I/II/III large subunit